MIHIRKSKWRNFFKSNFRIRWRANDVEDGEHAYIDLVMVTKEVDVDSYELECVFLLRELVGER